MLPELVFGAVVLYSVSRVGGSKDSRKEDSFGHHLPVSSGFECISSSDPVLLDLSRKGWDFYRWSGPKGSFVVGLFRGPDGSFPVPRGTNVNFVYPDGSVGVSLRVNSRAGRQLWSDLDLPVSRSGYVADLFVYHPLSHPGVFPEASGATSFGSVSLSMGGRGPGAGTGLSSGGGGRQHRHPYDWSGPVSSGGFHRWSSQDEHLEVPGESLDDDESWSFGEDGQIYDDDSGHVWSEEYGWISPVEAERFGINILGLSIPLSKADRVSSLEGKIDKAKQKVSSLEEEAMSDGADLESISKKIASLQTQIERWENKKDKVEIRMSGDDSFGLDFSLNVPDGLDDAFGEDIGEEE